MNQATTKKQKTYRMYCDTVDFYSSIYGITYQIPSATTSSSATITTATKTRTPQQEWQQQLYSTCNLEMETVIRSNAARVFWNTDQTKALIYAQKNNLKFTGIHQLILGWNRIKRNVNEHGSNKIQKQPSRGVFRRRRSENWRNDTVEQPC